MKSTTLQLSADYLLHVTARPVGERVHVHIESQWLGAKNPQGRETRYSVALRRHELADLVATLREAA